MIMRALACASVLTLTYAARAQDAASELTTTATTPKFVVLTGKGRGAPNLKRPVAKQVERKLKVFGEQVSFRQYRAAARAKKVKRGDLTSVATGRLLGKELGLTHVVFVESVRERESVGAKKRKKNVFYAEVTVLDVGVGEVAYTKRFKLAGRRLNAVLSAEIVAAVGENLTLPPPPEEPNPDLALEQVASPPSPPPPPETEPLVEEPTPAEPVVSEPVFEEPVEPAPSFVAVEPNEPEPKPVMERKRPARKGFELLVGPIAFERSASVSAANVSEDVNYDGPVPGAGFEFALFPLAFSGDGEFLKEAIGLKARGVVARVTTQFDPADDDSTVDSDVFGAEGGLAIRFPFGPEADSGDVTLVLGYALWNFPLDAGVFPGAEYQGPYGQLALNLPITEEFGIVLDGGGIPFLTTGGGLDGLGTFDSGLAFNINGGPKLSFEPFEIRLQGHYRSFSASFSGSSELGVGNELLDAELSDTYFGGSLLFGVAL